VLADVLTAPEGISETWDAQPIAWQREVLAAAIERIDIGPRTRSRWQPERVEIVWRTA
jgi:hypothetical protein